MLMHATHELTLSEAALLYPIRFVDAISHNGTLHCCASPWQLSRHLSNSAYIELLHLKFCPSLPTI